MIGFHFSFAEKLHPKTNQQWMFQNSDLGGSRKWNPGPKNIQLFRHVSRPSFWKNHFLVISHPLINRLQLERSGLFFHNFPSFGKIEFHFDASAPRSNSNRKFNLGAKSDYLRARQTIQINSIHENASENVTGDKVLTQDPLTESALELLSKKVPEIDLIRSHMGAWSENAPDLPSLKWIENYWAKIKLTRFLTRMLPLVLLISLFIGTLARVVLKGLSKYLFNDLKADRTFAAYCLLLARLMKFEALLLLVTPIGLLAITVVFASFKTTRLDLDLFNRASWCISAVLLIFPTSMLFLPSKQFLIVGALGVVGRVCFLVALNFWKQFRQEIKNCHVFSIFIFGSLWLNLVNVVCASVLITLGWIWLKIFLSSSSSLARNAFLESLVQYVVPNNLYNVPDWAFWHWSGVVLSYCYIFYAVYYFIIPMDLGFARDLRTNPSTLVQELEKASLLKKPKYWQFLNRMPPSNTSHAQTKPFSFFDSYWLQNDARRKFSQHDDIKFSYLAEYLKRESNDVKEKLKQERLFARDNPNQILKNWALPVPETKSAGSTDPVSKYIDLENQPLRPPPFSDLVTYDGENLCDEILNYIKNRTLTKKIPNQQENIRNKTYSDYVNDFAKDVLGVDSLRRERDIETEEIDWDAIEKLTKG